MKISGTTIKLISALLVSVMMISFSACQKQEKNSNDSTGNIMPAVPTNAAGEISQMQKMDLDGRTINFLTYCMSSISYSASVDIFPEEESTAAIDDALFRRNNNIFEKYNCKFDNSDIEYDQINDFVLSLYQSGDTTYDIMDVGMATAVSLGIEGLITPIENVPNIDTTRSYWYNNVMDETSIGHHTFFAIGDINWHSWDTTFVIYFNKRIADDMKLNDIVSSKYGSDSLYDLVKDGKWSYDKFFEIIRGIYTDNGNSKYDEDDLFGLSTSCDSVEAFLSGVQIAFVTKDKEDSLELTVNSKFYDFFPSLNDILNSNCTFFDDRPQYLSRWGEASNTVFKAGHSLFYPNTMMSGLASLRDMEDDYGILPFPKYSEEQEKYSSFNHFTNNSCICFPRIMKDAGISGMIAEDMGFFSSLYIQSGYFEKTLDGKLSRDPEDEEMLDIIIDNYQFDLVNYFYFNDLQLIYNELRLAVRNNNTAIASTINKYTKIYTGNLNKILQSIQENYPD